MLLSVRSMAALAPLPPSAPAVMLPPGWVMAPVAANDSVPGVVIVPASARSPATVRLTDAADTGPDTDSACVSVSTRPPGAVNGPSVPIWLAPPSVALAPCPMSVPTRRAPAPVSVMAPLLRRSSTGTVERLNAPAITTGPPVTLPTTRVFAATGGSLPSPPSPASVMPWPAVYSASATVPPGADKDPPRAKPSASFRIASVPPWPADTGPATVSAAASASMKSPLLLKPDRTETWFPA